jgi:hypothetical protein
MYDYLEMCIALLQNCLWIRSLLNVLSLPYTMPAVSIPALFTDFRSLMSDARRDAIEPRNKSDYLDQRLYPICTKHSHDPVACVTGGHKHHVPTLQRPRPKSQFAGCLAGGVSASGKEAVGCYGCYGCYGCCPSLRRPRFRVIDAVGDMPW